MNIKTAYIIIISALFLSCNNSTDLKLSKINTLYARDTLKKSIKDSVIIYKNEIDDNFYEEEDDDKRVYQKQLDSANIQVNFIAKGNYSFLKSKIKSQRNEFTVLYKSNTDINFRNKLIDSVRVYITKTFLNKIFPFWYGTPWDFDGYTATPNKGAVACGYFVSTTLRDAGFNLNRYHLAQQSPINEAKTIQLTDSVSIFNNKDYKTLKQSLLAKYKDGLYFIGLDCHVGFLWINNNEIYFIHSNYVYSEVEFEYAETSAAFLDNEQYIVADITNNDRLIKKWILNEEIDIVK